jgi:hypothetical protein
MNVKTKVPRFKSEAQERKFWEARDSAKLVDWSKAKRVPAQLEALDAEHLATPSGSHPRADQSGGERARCPLPVIDQGVAGREAFGVASSDLRIRRAAASQG